MWVLSASLRLRIFLHIGQTCIPLRDDFFADVCEDGGGGDGDGGDADGGDTGGGDDDGGDDAGAGRD